MSDHITYVKENRMIFELSNIARSAQKKFVTKRDLIKLIEDLTTLLYRCEADHPDDFVYFNRWCVRDEEYCKELQRLMDGAKCVIRMGDRVDVYGDDLDDRLGSYPYDVSHGLSLLNGEMVHMCNVKANTMSASRHRNGCSTFKGVI